MIEERKFKGYCRGCGEKVWADDESAVWCHTPVDPSGGFWVHADCKTDDMTPL